jgi:hypothetical protein
VTQRNPGSLGNIQSRPGWEVGRKWSSLAEMLRYLIMAVRNRAKVSRKVISALAGKNMGTRRQALVAQAGNPH